MAEVYITASGAVAAAREIQVGRVPASVNVNLNLNLNAQADLVLLNATSTFEPPVLRERRLSASAESDRSRDCSPREKAQARPRTRQPAAFAGWNRGEMVRIPGFAVACRLLNLSQSVVARVPARKSVWSESCRPGA